MQKIRGIVSGRKTSALIQKEVLILSDEERRSFLLDKAGISSSIELGAAEVLAIKAGLAIPCVTWDMQPSNSPDYKWHHVYVMCEL